LDLKWQGLPSIAETKNECSYTSTATIYLQGIERDNFTFTF